jgi:Domain of unknown function (DUF4115)
MMVAGIVLIVAVLAAAVTLLSRRRSHDDEHSVEGYHRQLHTLEGINAHPAGSAREQGSDVEDKPAYPETAFRVTGSSTVRLTDADHRVVPPVPPPPLASLGEPVKFDDTSRPTTPGTLGWGADDRTMQAINRRPRRLAGPALAVAAVIVLIVVLLLTGSHKVPPAHGGHGSDTAKTTPPRPRSGHGAATQGRHRSKAHQSTTTTTTPLMVSSAQQPTANGASYDLADQTYSLLVAATTGPCWLDVESTTGGTTLFTGVLNAGQQHTINATGSVTIVLGAPQLATVEVNGVPAVLPPGYQTPFTMHLVPFPSPNPST